MYAIGSIVGSRIAVLEQRGEVSGHTALTFVESDLLIHLVRVKAFPASCPLNRPKPEFWKAEVKNTR